MNITAAILVRQLGLVDYVKTYEAMRSFTQTRDANTPDEIWVLEHQPVFTLGLAADASHLLTPSKTIPLVPVDRGGQITYHGPGQLVVYLLLDLQRKSLLVKTLVHQLEQALIDTLAEYKVKAERHKGAPGIYLAEQENLPAEMVGAKIGALGLKVSRHASYHGLALNVAMDLSPFLQINPCGYAGLKTVDMQSLGIEDNIASVSERLVVNLQRHLQNRH